LSPTQTSTRSAGQAGLLYLGVKQQEREFKNKRLSVCCVYLHHERTTITYMASHLRTSYALTCLVNSVSSRITSTRRVCGVT